MVPEYALHAGYYKAAGLDVTLIPAGQGVDQVQMVAAGIATIGIDNPEPILSGRRPGREVQGFRGPVPDPAHRHDLPQG